jgi:hypothetical protein
MDEHLKMLLFLGICWVIIAVIVFSITYSQSTTHPREAEPLMWATFISSATCLFIMIFRILISSGTYLYSNMINLMYYVGGWFVFVFLITLLSVVFIESIPPAWKGLIPAAVASTVALFFIANNP